MSDFNPGANALIGPETMFTAYREEQLVTPGQQVLERIRPGAVTISHVHLHNPGSKGNPGLDLSIVDDPDPDTTQTIYVPTADTLVTGWLDNAAGALTFADVDERFNAAEFARNQLAVRKGGALTMVLRPTLGLAGVRILRATVGAVVMVGNNTGNVGPFTVEGMLRFNNVDFAGPRRALARATKGQTVVPLTATLAQPVWLPELATFHFDPSTGLPWTLTGFNTLDDANYGYGLTVRGQLAAGGFAVAGVWLDVLAATENRKGFLHMVGAPYPGWGRYALGSTGALNANQWYWLAMSCPYATANDWLRVPILRSVYTPEASAATETREHRRVSVVKLWTPAGVPPTDKDGLAPVPNPAVVDRTGEMMPMLLERAGPVIVDQSQPYAYLDLLKIDTTTQATLHGQQHTPAAGITMAGVMVPILWANPLVRPDRALIVEVQNGAGAITGTGTVRARAVIAPGRTVHNSFIIAPFDPSVAATFVTDGAQYHVIVKSAASVAKGWRFPRLDSRSDFIQAATAAYATPTTVANVEGTTYGGQTDSYFAGGVAYDRFDLPAVLVTGPTAPANLAATPLPAVAGDDPDLPEGWAGEISAADALPPRVALSWSATALGASWNGYRLWRRPRALPVRDWTLIGDYDPADYPSLTRTVLEAQLTRFIDYEAGYSVDDAEGVDGWDYAVQVRHLDGRESNLSESIDVANEITRTCEAWWACNVRPELNCSFSRERSRGSDTGDSQIVYEAAQHDHAVTRATGRVPVRRWSIRWAQHGYLSNWTMRVQEAAALSGEPGALLSGRGDRHYGTLDYPDVERDSDPITVARTDLVVTGRESIAARYNLPEEVAFDGVDDFISVASHAAINPGAGPFTFWLWARFPADDAGDVYLSKGAVAGVSAYGFRRSGANVIGARVAGAVVAGESTVARPTDGALHLLAADYDGVTLNLYLDGVLVDTDAFAAGAVTNGIALVAGADNAGASGFAATPTRAFGYYPRVLTVDEHKSLYRYFAQWFGARLPAGGVPVYDAGDLRCHDGVGTRLGDLGGSQYDATINGAPAIRGEPWPLAELDGR